MIDTHIHIDGDEYATDRAEVIARAQAAGCKAMLVPGVDAKSVHTVREVCEQYPGFCYPMLGLQPEEVDADWRDTLRTIHDALDTVRPVAIGEVGLDFHFSRDYEAQQREAFEMQVAWSIERRLPLNIHCRKAQNELMAILRPYADRLLPGVVHCFSGNENEAREILALPGFCLGIGGVLTFKNCHLADTLATVPLERIVLETDAPYLAPTPLRGKRNESANLTYVILRLAEIYHTTPAHIEHVTDENARRIFSIDN